MMAVTAVTAIMTLTRMAEPWNEQKQRQQDYEYHGWLFHFSFSPCK
jgi:hypothetical protein